MFMTNNKHKMDLLDDLWIHAFTFLNLEDLAKIMRVNKRFSILSRNNRIWKPIYLEYVSDLKIDTLPFESYFVLYKTVRQIVKNMSQYYSSTRKLFSNNPYRSSSSSYYGLTGCIGMTGPIGLTGVGFSFGTQTLTNKQINNYLLSDN